jgi:LacI family transcriptional regulator
MRLTIKDIARLAHTSPTAVSFVLNGKGEKRVSPATCKAILKVVRKHGYRRRSSARGLKLQRNFKVGLVVAGPLSEYPLIGAASHHDIVNLAARFLHERGYGVEMLQLDTHRKQADIARELEQEEVDGFLFVDFSADFLDRILFWLQEHNMPAVAASTRFPDESPYSWAAIARESSFQAGVEYLLGTGVQRVAMLDIDINGTFTAIKRRGYESAMRAHGLDPLPMFRLTAPTARAAHTATLELLKNVPDVEGVMLTDNLFAHIVQMAMDGHSCPLLGFGDESVARLCDPPLAFMRLPIKDLVNVCVENLLEWIENPDRRSPLHCLLPCELVLAETSNLPPQKSGE